MTNRNRWGRDSRSISDMAHTPLPNIQRVKQHLRDKASRRWDFEDQAFLKEADPLSHFNQSSKTQPRISA